MKALTKILLISGGALVVLGFGITAIAAAVGGGINGTIINGQPVKYDIIDYDFSDDINNISITETSHDIQIGKSSDSNTHVTVYDSEHHKHNVGVNGDTLEIAVNSDEYKVSWYQNFSIGIGDKNNPKVIVLLPEDEYQDLSITANSADLTSNNALTFENATVKLSSGDVAFFSKVNGNADIKTSSGEVLIDDMDPARLNVITSSGDIDIKNIENASISTTSSSGVTILTDISATDIKTEASSGEIKYINASVTGNITISASSGDINLNNVSADSLDSVTNSGDFTFSDLKLTNESFIKTSSGDVTGKSSGFMVISDTNSGDVNVDQVKDGTILNVSTSSGDISVK